MVFVRRSTDYPLFLHADIAHLAFNMITLYFSPSGDWLFGVCHLDCLFWEFGLWKFINNIIS
jgi:hypothetical protein